MKHLFNLLLSLFKPSRQQHDRKLLQAEFDMAIKDVERLMAKGDIDASGQALLKAEAIRKKITELNHTQD